MLDEGLEKIIDEGVELALTRLERLIWRQRLDNKKTYRSIGEEVGISRDRVSQSIKKSRRKIGHYIKQYHPESVDSWKAYDKATSKICENKKICKDL